MHIYNYYTCVAIQLYYVRMYAYMAYAATYVCIRGPAIAYIDGECRVITISDR